MKNILLFLCMMVAGSVVGQTAYVQVKGEPGLMVFLNGEFKGKTSVELGGCVIEDVLAGPNVIKIVKEGFMPFEERIVVKQGEVFAYKVRAFAKVNANVSEIGNTFDGNKKATMATGKLVVQSVPIEIKITMPEVRGVDNVQKTRDEWRADKIPVGNYGISFSFNEKTVSKTIEISANETTSVFVNMITGEFNSTNTGDEKIDKERAETESYLKVSAYIDSLCTFYKFKGGLSEKEFRAFNPEASRTIGRKNEYRKLKNAGQLYVREEEKVPTAGPHSFWFTSNAIIRYEYYFYVSEMSSIQPQFYYNYLLEQVKKSVPAEYIEEKDGYFTVKHPKVKTHVRFSLNNLQTWDAKRYRTININFHPQEIEYIYRVNGALK